MGRWLALDCGAKRMGLAVGHTRDGIAGPLSVIPAEPFENVVAKIRRLAAEYEAEGLVVGWPLNMDDSEGPQAKDARRTALVLDERLDLDVRLWDERLSSFEADKALAGQLTRAKRKARHDAIAAATFLQDFLACDGPDAAPRPADITEPPE
ncbi:MAG: Holliday junction resolvase RuvX [Planctomycetota bacterium]|jgi:putative Holliday junction resolvase